MPSAAQRRGAEIVADILAPVAGTALDPRTMRKDRYGSDEAAAVRLRGRPYDDRSGGVTVSIAAHPGKGFNGEYQQVVHLPLDETHPAYLHAHERIAQLLGRWCDMQRMALEYRSEVEACDWDPESGRVVENDMPTPASRINCPLILRSAMDRIGLDEDDRLRLVDNEGRYEAKGHSITIEKADEDDLERWNRLLMPRRSVCRCTLKGPGYRISLGVNDHYMEISQDMPETVRNAIIGMPLRLVVDIPWTRDVPGVSIARAGRNPKGGTRIMLSKAFGYLDGGIPIVGHGMMGGSRTAGPKD